MTKSTGNTVAAAAAALALTAALAPLSANASPRPKLSHHSSHATKCTIQRRLKGNPRRVVRVRVCKPARKPAVKRVLYAHIAAHHHHWPPPPPPTTTTSSSSTSSPTSTTASSSTTSSTSSSSTTTSSSSTTTSSSTSGNSGPGSTGLTTATLDAYDVQLGWPAVTGAASVSVYDNGNLVDHFPASSDDSYTVPELWPGTTYNFEVKVLNGSGATIGDFSGAAATPTASGAFPRLYAGSAFVNTLLPGGAALDSNSATIVADAITNYQGSANLSNNSAWGIPIVTASPQSSMYSVGCLYYGCSTNFPAVHIPSMATPDTGSDGHIVVLQPGGGEMDMWVAEPSGSSWTAGSRYLTTDTGSGVDCTTFNGCSGSDVAGFSLAAGLVRPEEIAQGHIDHALVITTPYTRQGYTACPATGSDGKNATVNALPIGAHVQLDPSINVAALNIPAWQKPIAVALQQYGAYVGDTGGSLAVEAESNQGRSYDAWAKAGVSATSPSLSDLPWSSMRVLSMTQCG